MENILYAQLNHRTIREFKDIPITEETEGQLLEVARRTATSNGLQQFSIIKVTDQGLKDEIASVGMQEYIKKVPTLFIFIADQYRNGAISRQKNGGSFNAKDMDRFFQSFTDACIAAQNVVNAAESMGLGTMYLGSILNDAEKIIELLKLPKLTFPVVGLAIGHPNQEPQLKPRFENNLRVFENEYQIFDDYLEAFQAYDEDLQTYYDLRMKNQRMDSFTNQVGVKMKMAIPKRQALMEIAQKQGFNVFPNKE